MQMILLGTPISAPDASAAGLLAGVFEPGTVLDHVIETATKLAGMSPVALSLAKEAVTRCKKPHLLASSHPDITLVIHPDDIRSVFAEL